MKQVIFFVVVFIAFAAAQNKDSLIIHNAKYIIVGTEDSTFTILVNDELRIIQSRETYVFIEKRGYISLDSLLKKISWFQSTILDNVRLISDTLRGSYK